MHNIQNMCFHLFQYTRNVRSLHRVDSLTTAERELVKYKLDLVGVQEIRWDRGSTEP
jgi:hypothetical protein